MKLTFSGAPEVAASRATVWTKLLDADFVARSAPGVDKVETLSPTQFRVVSSFGVGMIKLKFNLDIELFDVQEPTHVKLRARGKAPGSNIDLTSALDLEELSPTTTRLRWSAESDVSGTVASVGGRLLESTARKLTEDFWTDFARRVGGLAG